MSYIYIYNSLNVASLNVYSISMKLLAVVFVKHCFFPETRSNLDDKSFLPAGTDCKKISARNDDTRIRTSSSNGFYKQLSGRITE